MASSARGVQSHLLMMVVGVRRGVVLVALRGTGRQVDSNEGEWRSGGPQGNSK
jgi:hypothetical protein